MYKSLFVIIAMIAFLLSGCSNDLSSPNDDSSHTPSVSEKSNEGFKYTPSEDPVISVESALKGEADKDYCSSIIVHSVSISLGDTEKYVEQYTNFKDGWTKEYLTSHMVAVHSTYFAKYDGSKTHLRSGELERIFILFLNDKTSKWEIWDSTVGSLIS